MIDARRRGFTLVELLVVLGVIAVLIAILLPALSKTRNAAASVACKSLLRQCWLAGQMYALENKGVSVDMYRYGDFDAGLLKYFNVQRLEEKLTRCPGDNDVNLGEFGRYANPTYADADYKIFDKAGQPYAFRATIGLNRNVFSELVRRADGTVIINPANGRPVGQRWVKPYKLRNAVGQTNADVAQGYDPTRVMVWADYQYNLGDASNPAMANNPQLDAPVVKPGGLSTANVANHIGSITFRHGGTANVAFLDGHVGTMRPANGLKLKAGGIQLADGQVMVQGTDASQPNYVNTTKPMPRHFYLLYPFGPGAEGSTNRMLGNFPTLQVD